MIDRREFLKGLSAASAAALLPWSVEPPELDPQATLKRLLAIYRAHSNPGVFLDERGSIPNAAQFPQLIVGRDVFWAYHDAIEPQYRFSYNMTQVNLAFRGQPLILDPDRGPQEIVVFPPGSEFPIVYTAGQHAA